MATSLVEDERITIRQEGDVERQGNYVLYWMQAAQRAQHNQALEYAIQQANDRGLPVAVLFCVVDHYPEASRRHYDFMLRGLATAATAIRNRNLWFECRHGDPTDLTPTAATEAALLVMDQGIMRGHREWRDAVVAATDNELAIHEVQTEVVVPVDLVTDKMETAARTIRPKVNKHRDDYVVELNTTAVDVKPGGLQVPGGRTAVDLGSVDQVLETLDIDAMPGPVKGWSSGTSAAMGVLDDFIRDVLPDYDDARNRYDEENSSSRLSPYLHYGQISPVEIVRRVQASDAPAEHVDSFVEEIVIRRELAINHALHNPDYDSFAGLPEWARISLDLHKDDEREDIYTANELDEGQTHDPVWNAIQFLVRSDGWVHNQLRMYWGKQIVRWTNTPGHAYRTLLELNNRYFLDGRDANSYSNVAWCFGRHDQGFAERDVSGKLRPFTTAALKRKGDLNEWLESVESRMAGSDDAS